MDLTRASCSNKIFGIQQSTKFILQKQAKGRMCQDILPKIISGFEVIGNSGD